MISMNEKLKSYKCPVDQTETFPSGLFMGGYQIFYCKECNHRFTPDAYTSEINYDELYSSGEYMENQIIPLKSEFNRKRFHLIGTYKPFFKMANKKNGEKLLDIGCGIGRFCHAAHQHGWDVKGIDLSEKAIEIGKQFAPFPLEVKTVMEEFSLYNAVTAFEVLEHIENPADFLVSVRPLLLPEGQVLMTVPNWDCTEVQTAERPDWLPPVHLNFFTKESLTKLFEISGYKRIKAGYIGSNPVPESMISLMFWLVTLKFIKPNNNVGLWIYAIAE